MDTLSKYYSNYKKFKETLDAEMTRMAERFVRIGYLLSYAAETNIINEGGYKTVNDFAKAEYGIEATQVSRFVGIYKRFGVEGEPRLKEQYSNHGVAKLGIMLTLPDFLNEEISAEYSKSEINAIKHEYEAEQQVSDVEVAIEHAEMKESVQYSLPQMLEKAVYQLIHDEPALYERLYDCMELDDMKEILAPIGENSYIVRIKGIGRLTIFLKNAGVDLINLREGSSEGYSWQQLFNCFKEHFVKGTDAKDSWCNVFQEEWPLEEKKEPEKTAETPVKPDKDNVKPSKLKKESKVKVVTPKPKKEPEPKVKEPVKKVEEQLPGQDSILNHPEYLPEDMHPEVLTGEVEDIKETPNPENDNVQQSSEDFELKKFAPVQDVGTEHVIESLKNMVKASVNVMHDLVEKEDWSMVIGKATVLVHNVKKIQKLEDKNQ